MEMKRGDLEPALVLEVEDVDGVADLNDVASWRILGKMRDELVVDGVADLVVVDPENPAKATLTREWVAGETDQVGAMQVEVEAMWPGDRPQTFPCVGYAIVRFATDLG